MRAATPLALLALLTGCPRPFWIGFEGVPQPGRPAFRLSTSPGGTESVVVRRIRVIRCFEPGDSPDRLLWEIAYDSRSGRSARLSRVAYGIVPAGFREIVPSRPLEPLGCYVVQAMQTDEDEFGESLFLRGTLDGGVALISGFEAESLAPTSARPQPLPDTLSTLELPVPPSVAITVVREELSTYGIEVAETPLPGSVLVSRPLALHHNWGGQRLDARIDCGRYATGWSRVMLPLADEPVGGHGKLQLTLQVSFFAAGAGTRVRMQDEVTLYPPWYEHGDRPLEHCHITDGFAAALFSGFRKRAATR